MTTREYIIDWEPHRAQGQFIEDWRPLVGFVGGIGSGKTLSGWMKVLQMTPDDGVGCIVAPTYRQLRDGVLATLKERLTDLVRDINLSSMTVTLVTGVKVLLRSASRPDDFRSLNLGWLWIDEACYLSRYALRTIVSRVRQGAELIFWTSSPVKGSAAHELWVQPGQPYHHAKTTDNTTLSAQYIDLLRSTLSAKEARREIDAEWVDAGGVLFSSESIAACRVDSAPKLTREVIGVDPATTSKRRSDRTGIVHVGRGADGHAYVLGDYSGQMAPHEWAKVVCELARERNALVVCETNQGGDLVERNLRAFDPRIAYNGVHAGHSKSDRAQPIATLYERGWAHHVGPLRELERQMTTWEPSDAESPDRLDAAVWALIELDIQPRELQSRRLIDMAPATRPRVQA
jgi:phage terminase large subunit-like protein